MFRLTILFLLLLVPVCAGCPKDAARSAAQAPPTADAKPQVSPAERRAAEESVEGIPEQQQEQIRAELLAQAGANGVTYNEETGVLLGIGPPQGVLLDLAVGQIYSIGRERGDLNDAEFLREAVRQYYEVLMIKVREEADAQPVDPAVQQKIEEQVEAGQEYLRPAGDIIGDWRSEREVREGQDTLLLEHNDDYYKILLVPFESTKIVMTEWRDGKEVSLIEFQYTYDGDTGELTTLTPDGSPGPVYIVKHRLSEPRKLYVKPHGEFIYTVYDKIGNGGRPPTQAELDAMADQAEAAEVRRER